MAILLFVALMVRFMALRSSVQASSKSGLQSHTVLADWPLFMRSYSGWDLLHSSTPLSFIQRTIIRAVAHHVQPRLEYCERTFASVVRANKAMPMHLGSKFGAKWRFFGWLHCLDTSEAQQSCRSLNYQWLHSTCWCSQRSKIGRIHKPGLPGSNPSHKDRQMLSAHLLPHISTRARHLLFCLICR